MRLMVADRRPACITHTGGTRYDDALMRRAILLAWVASVAIGAAQTAPPVADTILVNGHIVTVDARFSTAQAVAIADPRFTAVGTDAVVRKMAGPSATIIDLKGRTTIPGLADDHLHDAGGGPGVDVSRARTMADLVAAVAARVRQSRAGDIITSNSDWHEAQLREHRLPHRGDLDTVPPDNPVVVVRGGHEFILNSAALRKWRAKERFLASPLAGAKPPAARALRAALGRDEHRAIAEEMARFL